MSIKLNVKVTEKIMYDFMLYHNYSHLNGIAGAILGALGLWLGLDSMLAGNVQSAVCGFAVALLFLLMPPFRIRKTAKRQVSDSGRFQEPIEYELHEEGVTVRQGEEELMTPWADFRKAVSTNNALVLYVTKVRAMILPKACMGQMYEETVKMISTHMPPAKVRIRHIH